MSIFDPRTIVLVENTLWASRQAPWKKNIVVFRHHRSLITKSRKISAKIIIGLLCNYDCFQKIDDGHCIRWRKTKKWTKILPIVSWTLCSKKKLSWYNWSRCGPSFYLVLGEGRTNGRRREAIKQEYKEQHQDCRLLSLGAKEIVEQVEPVPSNRVPFLHR